MLNETSDKLKKVLAFISLMIIQICLLLFITLSKNQGINYNYNPASAICMAEFIKLIISIIGFIWNNGNFEEIISIFYKRKDALIIYSVLAMFYCINNQMTFISLELTTPGNVALIKSITPFLTAVLQCLVNKSIVINLEWIAILLVCSGLVITQWNDCTSSLNLPFTALLVLMFSSSLTAVSSVGNSYILKSSKISKTPIMLQNMLLYSFGIIFNLLAYHLDSFGCFYKGGNDVNFFDGYDNIFAISVVLLNGLIGIAITFVYKYGDAIIKCFAQVLSSIILVILSALFFDTKFTIISFCGTIVVFSSSYVYLLIIPNLKKNLQKLQDNIENNDNTINDRDEKEKILLLVKK